VTTTGIGANSRSADAKVDRPHELEPLSWAEIGELVGQRSRVVTADTYSHALVDPREIDRAALLS
jgi:hypothetical protein